MKWSNRTTAVYNAIAGTAVILIFFRTNANCILMNLMCHCLELFHLFHHYCYHITLGKLKFARFLWERIENCCLLLSRRKISVFFCIWFSRWHKSQSNTLTSVSNYVALVHNTSISSQVIPLIMYEREMINQNSNCPKNWRIEAIKNTFWILKKIEQEKKKPHTKWMCKLNSQMKWRDEEKQTHTRAHTERSILFEINLVLCVAQQNNNSLEITWIATERKKQQQQHTLQSKFRMSYDRQRDFRTLWMTIGGAVCISFVIILQPIENERWTEDESIERYSHVLHFVSSESTVASVCCCLFSFYAMHNLSKWRWKERIKLSVKITIKWNETKTKPTQENRCSALSWR